MKLLASVGTINPPAEVIVINPGESTDFIAGLVRGSIQLLLVIAFIVALIWTIFAGYKFIFAGGDEKAVSSAWSQIYWGMIGLVVVVGAFAIIKLVEIFFDVNIVSGGFVLPTRFD